MKKRGTPAFFLVFWAHSKAVSLNIKNDGEGHRASFLVFWAHSKAVSRFIKNDEEGHRVPKGHEFREGARHGDVVLRHAVRDDCCVCTVG